MNYPEKFGEEYFSQQEDKISDMNDKTTLIDQRDNSKVFVFRNNLRKSFTFISVFIE